MADEETHITAEIDAAPVIVDWCNKYEPCTEAEADVIFSIGRLRDEFAAWGFQPGYETDDPLIPYIKALAKNGFHVQQTYGAGPAIVCKHKQNQMDFNTTQFIKKDIDHGV